LILKDAVLLAKLCQSITVGPCQHTLLSSKNVKGNNPLPDVFFWMRLQGGSMCPLYPIVAIFPCLFIINYTMELVTGDDMLINGGYVHCAGKFVNFQTDAAQTWS
jgi:hypothetical protein